VSTSIRTFLCWYGRPAVTPPDEVMGRYSLIVGQGCAAGRREALRRLRAGIRFTAYCNAIDFRVPPDAPDVEFIRTAGEPAPEHRHPDLALRRDLWENHRDFLLRSRLGGRGSSAEARRAYVWGYQRPYDRRSRHANRFFLDPRTGWRDHYADLCAETMAEGGFDGVFCDNAGPRIEWNFAALPAELRPEVTDAEWSAAVAAMLAGVSRRLKRQHPGALVFANTCGGFVADDADDIRPTPFWRAADIDGAMDEFFAFAAGPNRGDGYLPEATWRRQVRAILCCESLGRGYLAQSNGREDDHAGRLYALASFLLAAGARSAFNYNPAAAATYSRVYRLPEWDLDLGPPAAQYGGLAEARDAGGGAVYARRFEDGFVAVNPSDEARSVRLGGRYGQVCLEGGTIARGGTVVIRLASRGLTLGPRSAAILSGRL